MNTLGKSAAVASIIAAFFTVAAYFNQPQPVVIEKFKEPQASGSNVIALADAKEKSEPGPLEELESVESFQVAVDEPLNDQELSIKARHKIALKIPGSITQSNVLEKLAKEAADLGYYRTAYQAALDIKGSITRNSTLSYIAIKIAESGNIEFASEVANSIQGSVTKNSTLEKIIGM